jgi:hypothetical protein
MAAFLGGFLIGRKRDGPARKKPNTGNQEPVSAIDKQAAEKLRREWANFLTYDGTAQEPTE